MNRKRISNNRKRNLKNKLNKKNIKEKQAKDPARMLTTKPLYVLIPSYLLSRLRACLLAHMGQENA